MAYCASVPIGMLAHPNGWPTEAQAGAAPAEHVLVVLTTRWRGQLMGVAHLSVTHWWMKGHQTRYETIYKASPMRRYTRTHKRWTGGGGFTGRRGCSPKISGVHDVRVTSAVGGALATLTS
jgi:hypothetical protein